MAANIIEDERLDDDKELDNINDLQKEAPQEPTPAEDDVPEKYKGKSTAEIVRMHQEAEKLLGKQSGEVGELRSVVDSYIQTQLDTTPTQTTELSESDEDIDFFSDPDKAVARAISNHPSVKKAEETTLANLRTTALKEIQARHPDMQELVQDAKFVEWIKSSKIRTQLFAQADRQFDYEAADELFSNWKNRQGVVAQTAAAEKDTRKAAVKSASTGSTRGTGEQRAKKVYRRSDIIKLMKTDPDRYMSLSDEITQAYAEGRVR